jgi:hypothetical protein
MGLLPLPAVTGMTAPRSAIVATEKKLRVERFLPALGSGPSAAQS